MRGACASRIFERPFQRAMHDQIRVAANRRSEMRVFLGGQREVAEQIGGVARLFQRTQHQVRKNALFRLAGDFFREPLIVLRANLDFFRRGQRHAHRAHAAMARATAAAPAACDWPWRTGTRRSARSSTPSE